MPRAVARPVLSLLRVWRTLNMSTNTLIIIVVLILLFGGGGYYWRGRRR
ncbi:MAG: LPXTG cell wall anchor domain-containing protein [Thermoanaerobaculia bacterium]